MFTVQSIHVAFEIWGSIFCLIAAICMWFSNFKGMERKLLLYMQFAAFILLIMDAFAWWYRGSQGTVGYYMVRISNFFVFFMSDALMLLYHKYMCLHLFKDREQEKKPLRVSIVTRISIVAMFW